MRIVKVIVAVPERTFHPFATLTVNRMDDIEEYNWENDRCVNLSRS
jgi:hypothetical protein